MMFERFTQDARTVVVQAQHHARRLGHRYIGCEHLLLAVASTGQPASDVLREHGVTPEHVEEIIVSRVGLGAGAGLFADLDRDALASIGIDLDAVRARIEASFGPEALAQAARAGHRRSRPSRLSPRRAVPPGLVARWRRRRARRALPAAPAGTVPAAPGGSVPAAPPPAGRYQAPGPPVAGHIPFTPAAKKSLENALREAVARRDGYIGVEHLAVGLIATKRGMVAPILAALGTSAPALRTAILDRYRQAS
jgi:Clp amino terminal domain, pathogenicity island component